MSGKPALEHLSPISRVFLLVGLLLLSIGIVSVVALLILKPLFGLNIIADPSVLSNYEDKTVIAALKFLQTVQAISIFIIPPVGLALLVSSAPSQYLRLKISPGFISILLVIVIMLAAMPVINWMAEINGKMKLPGFLAGVEEWMRESETSAARITEVFLRMNSIRSYLFNMFMIALLPAIGEELLFRGVIQKLAVNLTKNIHVGVLITAILFSAMHMQFYGFLPRMMLGLLFGYMVVWSDSLWLPILGHFINNGAAVTLAYLVQKGIVNDSIETAGSGAGSLGIVITGFLLLTIFILLLYRQEKLKAVTTT